MPGDQLARRRDGSFAWTRPVGDPRARANPAAARRIGSWGWFTVSAPAPAPPSFRAADDRGLGNGPVKMRCKLIRGERKRGKRAGDNDRPIPAGSGSLEVNREAESLKRRSEQRHRTTDSKSETGHQTSASPIGEASAETWRGKAGLIGVSFTTSLESAGLRCAPAHDLE